MSLHYKEAVVIKERFENCEEQIAELITAVNKLNDICESQAKRIETLERMHK